MRRAAALTLVLIGAFSACGGSTSTTTAATSAGSGDATSPTSNSRSLRCEPLSAKRLNDIATGVVAGSGVTLSDGFAVKSKDFSKVWFVAARITGPDVDEVGVWATNGLDSGLIFAIDGFAGEFTDWGKGGSTDAKLSMRDDGAEDARACVA